MPYKIRRIIISDPIYDTQILVQRYGSLLACVKEYSKRIGCNVPDGIEENPRRRGFFLAKPTERSSMIWLSKDAQLGVISHETFHATCHILGCVGLTLTSESEEAYTYYQQFLVNSILTGLYGHKYEK